MIDWPTVCPAIQGLIAAVAELPENQVTWRDQQQPYNPDALVKLHNTAERGIGWDYGAIEGDEKVTYGLRAWTLNVQVEAVSQEFDAFAPFYCSRIRTRFQQETTRQELRRLTGVVIFQDFPSIDVTLIDGDRHWSKYQDSYELHLGFREVDNSEYEGIPASNWIERMRAVGSLNDGTIETDQTIILGRQFGSGFDSGFQKNDPRVLE